MTRCQNSEDLAGGGKRKGFLWGERDRRQLTLGGPHAASHGSSPGRGALDLTWAPCQGEKARENELSLAGDTCRSESDPGVLQVRKALLL